MGRAAIRAARLRAMVSAEGCRGWAPVRRVCCGPTSAAASCRDTASCVMSEGAQLCQWKGCCKVQPEDAAADPCAAYRQGKRPGSKIWGAAENKGVPRHVGLSMRVQQQLHHASAGLFALWPWSRESDCMLPCLGCPSPGHTLARKAIPGQRCLLRTHCAQGSSPHPDFPALQFHRRLHTSCCPSSSCRPKPRCTSSPSPAAPHTCGTQGIC